MSEALAAKGTLLKVGNAASPEVFTTLAEVVNISGPGLKAEALDVTHMSSTDGFREFVGGLIDGGEISLEVNFLPSNATHTGLSTDMYNRTLRNFKLTWPLSPAVNWSFSAIVTGYEPGAPVDGKLSANITLKLSGKPNLAAS